MKKFFTILLSAVVFTFGIRAADLGFIVDVNGTPLTPVLQDNVNNISYGFYDLAGNAINEDGTSRTSTAPLTAAQIAVLIAAQYDIPPGNSTIIIP